MWLVPGFSYAEQHVGTNGIGTALEGRRPTEVFGHEHFVEHLEDLACAGAPIRHPVTGKILGVIDLTCWRTEANALMVATAATTARRIEEALLAASGRHELTLLHDYLTAVQRGGDSAVLAVGDDLVMMNDRARELIAPATRPCCWPGRPTRCGPGATASSSSTCRAGRPRACSAGPAGTRRARRAASCR